MARIKANLRRVDLDRHGRQDAPLALGPIRVDVAGRQVESSGHRLILQPKEFDLLVYFMRHPGQVLTRSHLLHAVWRDEFVGERTVDVHVRRLRAKLEAADTPDPIRTVHGVGYVFEPARSRAGGSDSDSTFEAGSP
jgi:DNA-binding response OmpR family regulator